MNLFILTLFVHAEHAALSAKKLKSLCVSNRSHQSFSSGASIALLPQKHSGSLLGQTRFPSKLTPRVRA
jgi:hypothetical protein